jgi:pimeloyl-ACP methyl ester carboxylesterase
VTHRLIEEGREHLLLRGAIDLDRPVWLIHGMADEEVPWRTSLGIAERLTGPDVRVILIKDGDHRLSRERDLALLGTVVDALAQELGA